MVRLDFNAQQIERNCNIPGNNEFLRKYCPNLHEYCLNILEY